MAKNNSPLYQFGAASIAGAVAGLGLDGSVGADNTNQTVGAVPQTPDPINPDPLSALNNIGNIMGGEQYLNAINANPQVVGSTVGANRPTNTTIPVDRNVQAQSVQPGSLEAVQPPPPPNLAPINPRAVSAPGTVADVFGENTEGQYGRQTWNAQ